MRMISKDEIGTRLAEFQKVNDLPGFKTEESRARFIEEVWKSKKRFRALSMLKSSNSADLYEKEFDPVKTIVKLFNEGHLDEAVWLSFLTTHFGQDAKNTIGQFYRKFGEGLWDWDSIYENVDSIRNWMVSNEDGFKHLKFGNHRKFETKDPDSPNGTPAVIQSFVEWVKKTGDGSPYQALRVVSQANTPEERFDTLYQGISLIRFGRTAKFDFLCLLGNLGILEISPPHCYLGKSTGPKGGALLMVEGKIKGRVTANIEEIIGHLCLTLGISVEVMEDALCNWQKARN